MKNVTMLDVGGASYEIEYASVLRSGVLVIERMDERPLSQVAEDFEGRETLTRMDKGNPNIKVTYAGYTELIDIRRNQADGSVRLTLKKP